MNILVANLGSTSYKYTLFRSVEGSAPDDVVRGRYERVTDHGKVISESLETLLRDGHLKQLEDLDAVVFKSVLGHNLSGCREAGEDVLEALDKAAALAPAHNPPYAEGIRQFAKLAPQATLVALFETAFYQWIPAAHRLYAVPIAWREIGIERNGFHGANHKFIAEHSAQLLGREDVAERVRNLYHGDLLPLDPKLAEKPLRVVSCHLGGSSSVTGIRDGVAIGTSMGLSPQSGLPQNNRVGDLDSMAIPHAMKTLDLDLAAVERVLTKESGLLGLSGVSEDIRDIEAAAKSGNAQAQQALEFFAHEIRRWASSFLFDLGGIDALVFTGGIGENSFVVRELVCKGLENFGLKLDASKNANSRGVAADLSAADAGAKILVIPANEEQVLAAEAERFLRRKHQSTGVASA